MSLPTCPSCVYAKGVCEKTGVKIRHSTGCTYHKQKPMTNYDLLISKTPEELAKYLTQAWYDGPVFECPARSSVGVDRCAEVKDCEDCFLDWLRNPVEEEDE